MNEREALELLRRHCETADPLRLELQPFVAMSLLSHLQLALRHPGNRGPSRKLIRQFCDDLIDCLSHGDQQVASILRSGDNPECDVP